MSASYGVGGYRLVKVKQGGRSKGRGGGRSGGARRGATNGLPVSTGREERRSRYDAKIVHRGKLYTVRRAVSWTNHGTMMTAGLASGRPINHGLRCGNLCLHATYVWAYAIGKTFTPVRARSRASAGCCAPRPSCTHTYIYIHIHTHTPSAHTCVRVGAPRARLRSARVRV